MLRLGPFLTGVATSTVASMYFCMHLNDKPEVSIFQARPDYEQLQQDYSNRLYDARRGMVESDASFYLAKVNCVVAAASKQIGAGIAFVRSNFPLE